MGKGASMCLAVYATISLATLSLSIQNWFHPFHQISLAQLWYPSSLTVGLLHFLLFCILKALYVFYNHLVHFHWAGLSLLSFYFPLWETH